MGKNRSAGLIDDHKVRNPMEQMRRKEKFKQKERRKEHKDFQRQQRQKQPIEDPLESHDFQYVKQLRNQQLAHALGIPVSSLPPEKVDNRQQKPEQKNFQKKKQVHVPEPTFADPLDPTKGNLNYRDKNQDVIQKYQKQEQETQAKMVQAPPQLPALDQKIEELKQEEPLQPAKPQKKFIPAALRNKTQHSVQPKVQSAVVKPEQQQTNQNMENQVTKPKGGILAQFGNYSSSSDNEDEDEGQQLMFSSLLKQKDPEPAKQELLKKEPEPVQQVPENNEQYLEDELKKFMAEINNQQ